MEVQAHESDLTLKYGDSRIDVHLGFLQINRHYDVLLTIKDDLGEDLEVDPLQNLHAQITKYEPTEDGKWFHYCTGFFLFYTPANKVVWGVYEKHPVCLSVCLYFV